MRYFVSALSQILVFVFFSISASAQQAEPAGKETPRFSGVYLGAGGGYSDAGEGGSGGFGDLFIGGRIQTDSGLVYGVEGAVALFDAADADPDTIYFFDFDGSASAIAKLGYTSDNRWMVYGGAGYTSVGVNDPESAVDNRAGVVFEAGLEYMPTSYFGLRLRGQYHAVGNDSNVTNVGASLLFSF